MTHEQVLLLVNIQGGRPHATPALGVNRGGQIAAPLSTVFGLS